MTIKLSTTNSVNKTLQHKALWELETPYWEVGGPSWLLWTPEMVESFLWERSTGFCIRTRREDYCLSSSVNKLCASMSETALFDTATRDRNSFRGPASLCEMHRKKINTLNYQVHSEMISRTPEVKNGKEALSRWLGLNVMCHDLFSAGLQISQVDRETIWANGLPDLSALAVRKTSPR